MYALLTRAVRTSGKGRICDLDSPSAPRCPNPSGTRDTAFSRRRVRIRYWLS